MSQITKLACLSLVLATLAGCSQQRSDKAKMERVAADSVAMATEVDSVTSDVVGAPDTVVILEDHLSHLAVPKKSKKKNEGDYGIVKTFFATDRDQKPGTNRDPDDVFGDGRSMLKYGSCDVSIPRDHQMGELEAPSIWRFQFRENPDKHVVLLSTRVMVAGDFYDSLRQRVHSSEKANAFVFVHGYNVSFEDAARRTAQMSYDLSFDGAPIFYSWPSRGKTAAYTVDEQTIEWSQSNLKIFLAEFFDKSEAQNVYLIAHSMGNRALTRCIAALLIEKPEIKPRLTEIILTAPDVDADVFRRDIAPAIIAGGRPVTLYASSNDLALVASRRVHGSPRAGDSGRGLIILAGIETVDASNVDTDFLGHSYFATSRTVLSDIFYLVHEGQRANTRFGLQPMGSPPARYWAFKN